MGYNWEGKEEVCYRMYIEERRSLEDIMEFMRTEHDFAPSKRAFQTQFKRWEFPSKQNPAHRNVPLVTRVRELWEHNTSQKDMLRILRDEGFDIKERELMRVRAKNRWLLRVPNGMKSADEASGAAAAAPVPTAMMMTAPTAMMTTTASAAAAAAAAPKDGPAGFSEFEQAMLEQQGAMMAGVEVPQSLSTDRAPTPGLPPDEVARRQERMAQLQQESADRWASRKRRRRTRGWAGLPADPPGPPRFPSETTIDESKAYLSLDNDLYRELRDRFQGICEEGGFLKKTVAGPERWQAAKDRLVHETPHLQSIFWGSNSQLDAKVLALDVVCSDVTKRMRTMERRMTIADAKNTLGINPEQSREIRNAFYQTLKSDHFSSKLEAGEDHWRELKDRWINSSELLVAILAPGEADPHHGRKLRAIEVLCRDVMKRLRDDQAKKDPSKRRPRVFGPGPGPATPAPTTTNRSTRNQSSALAQAAAAAAPPPPPPAMSQPNGHPDHGDLQIDPSLLLAANDPSLVMDQHQPHFGAAFVTSAPYAARPPTSLPVYFRLSPTSQVPQSVKVWLGTLGSISVHELRQLASSKNANAVNVRIEGIIRDEGNNEVPVPIDEDDELEAYLTHVDGGKATFNVQLMPVYP